MYVAVSDDDLIDTFDMNENNGKLAAFRIDQNSKDLERIDAYDVGKSPRRVLITGLG